jgi:glycosyltransferase involved in cell wall biosynthesis
MSDNNSLLTIAIPTYNRSNYLDLNLSILLPQAKEYGNLVEILVSNNCSTDNTEEVLAKYIAQDYDMVVFNHKVNRGMDWNFIQCFNLSRSKYLLVLGDDDLILDGGLKRIIEFLRENEVGVLYLSSYGFKDNYVTERPQKDLTGVEIFSDVERFLEKVHYWITFLSGNVVNKSFMPVGFDSSRHQGTNLPQVNWILNALFQARQNAVISDYTIAFKSENTGGYKLCEVFGKNLNSIFEYFILKGVPARYFDVIRRKLVLSFFPNLILILRSGNTKFNLDLEDYYHELKAHFSKYAYFWIVTVPAIKFPVLLARIWMRLVILIDRVTR